VSNPSNWVRILELYGHDDALLRKNLSTYSFTDIENIEILQKLYAQYGYIADPHGALGFEALNLYLKDHPGSIGVFLETAHPIKFMDTIKNALNITLPLPTGIESLMRQEKKSIQISDYDGLKAVLLSE